MLLFLIGLVCGVIAYRIGKWRHACVFWLANEPFNLPLGWRQPAIRFGTLAAVAIFSATFASCWAFLIGVGVNKFIGAFSWGVLLMIRWTASGIAARLEGRKFLAEINRQRTDQPKRPLKDLMAVSICDMSPEEAKEYMEWRRELAARSDDKGTS
jgi:hypothetical protein